VIEAHGASATACAREGHFDWGAGRGVRFGGGLERGAGIVECVGAFLNSVAKSSRTRGNVRRVVAVRRPVANLLYKSFLMNGSLSLSLSSRLPLRHLHEPEVTVPVL
jgi:hypothetical protein